MIAPPADGQCERTSVSGYSAQSSMSDTVLLLAVGCKAHVFATSRATSTAETELRQLRCEPPRSAASHVEGVVEREQLPPKERVTAGDAAADD